jgi:mRNA interferase HigB
MKLVGRHLLMSFMQRHGDARGPMGTWVSEVEEAAWQSTSDIKAKYPSASFLSNNEVIFNIKGNKYRLKVLVAYGTQTVVVQKVGTHAEYNRW